jgi:hypothetical protein
MICSFWQGHDEEEEEEEEKSFLSAIDCTWGL